MKQNVVDEFNGASTRVEINYLASRTDQSYLELSCSVEYFSGTIICFVDPGV